MSPEDNQDNTRNQDYDRLRFQSLILDQIYDNVTVVGMDGIIKYVNKAECEMMGCEKEDLIGRHISIYGDVPLDDDPGIPIFDHVLEKGSWRGEVFKYNRKGEKIYLDNRIGLIYSEVGEPVGMCGISTDITKRKNADKKLKKTEAKLRQQNEKLKLLNEKLKISNKRITDINEELNRSMKKAEESDMQKSVFLANMSHEIRTPMNGILGFTNLLKKPGLRSDKKDLYLRIIEQSGQRMLGLIDNIVDISKIEAGLAEVAVEKTDINLVLRELYEFFRPEVKSKGLAINLLAEPGDRSCIIETDRQKLEQIISNLIKNAIKFTDEGHVDVGYKVEAGYLKLFVSDTGPGIEEENHEKIFGRFQRVIRGEKSGDKGTGLGLAICRSLVTLLGGNIWLESEPGKGSTFYVSLPLSEKQGKEEDTENMPEGRSGERNNRIKPRILVAEDDYFSAEYLKALLTPMAEKLFMADTGQKAVEICRENPGIDIILMDIKMPEMNGLEATRLIREFNDKVYIIAQTAFTLHTDRKNAVQAGCNEYITKPIKAQELKNLIIKLSDATDRTSDH